ncbi:MAG: undecaprenyldiphospho-muramoylpentapeptide beta-N-acetylglucosaminyltransferase [Bacteroidetes bacterium]|nr:undecaprenyldiphospho-muramoylpentapeptide beta-N-acetylglucosaminyltransferase [Bacteroidota bacterium]
MPNKKVIISGGGTGGHIFPAIAIANAIKRRSDDVDILFVGAKGRMEMRMVPDAGYPIKGLWISGIQRRITWKNLLFPLKLITSLIKASFILLRFKPDVVIGVGGYASGPTLKMANRFKIPTLIQEQNSYPGITNRWLAKEINTVCVAYENMDKYFPEEKIVKTGNPVRVDVIDIEGKEEEARNFFGLDADKKTILIIGGSQGALSINKAIHRHLASLVAKDYQLIWQTGRSYIEEATVLVQDPTYKNVKVHQFIKRMDLAYASADLVISRAGAIAIAELCAVQKPVIFIPLPSAAEDHQTKNAMALVNSNSALMVKDTEAPEILGAHILQLMNDLDKQKELKENIKKHASFNAPEMIVNEVFKLM